MRTITLILGLILAVDGHGTVVSPRSRNSVDYLVGINSPKDWPSNAHCANITGDECHNGQATFWYSQGCFIGCDECDHKSGRRNIDLCGNGMIGTLPERFRSVNRDSKFLSDEDICTWTGLDHSPFGLHAVIPCAPPAHLPVQRPVDQHASLADKHNPWRAPGNAPTADACGLAGGTPWAAEAPEAGDYTTTIYAHHGMKGTSLKPLLTGVEWKIGGEGEVTFQISNNHGGGYSYRVEGGLRTIAPETTLLTCPSEWNADSSLRADSSAPTRRTRR